MNAVNITNPFEEIHLRFNHIENLLLQLHASNLEKLTKSIEEDIILDVDQAADYIKLSIPSIYRLCSAGEMPVIKKGKKLLFSKKALTEWLMEGRKLTLSEIQRRSEIDHS